MSNNVQILNFNHNVVEVAGDNKLVITDNTKNNSITIPQPVTNILQINSPGLQGPIGPSGSQGPAGPSVDTGSFAITGSNIFLGNQDISGSVTITGSITFDGGASISGSDNFDIIVNSRQWTFGNDGYLVLPQVDSLTDQAGIKSNGDIIIQADDTQSWRFISGSGVLQAPGGIEAPSFTGSLDISTGGNLGLQYKFIDLTSVGNYVIADNSPATVYRFSNASSTNYQVELPSAGSCPNRTYWISRSNDGTVIGTVTLTCSSNIEDNTGVFNTNFNIGENSKHQFISDGISWIMIMQ